MWVAGSKHGLSTHFVPAHVRCWGHISAGFCPGNLEFSGKISQTGHVVPEADLASGVRKTVRGWEEEVVSWLGDMCGSPRLGRYSLRVELGGTQGSGVWVRREAGGTIRARFGVMVEILDFTLLAAVLIYKARPLGCARGC